MENNEQVLEQPLESLEPANLVETQPVVVENTYTYQPTDESGRAIGGKQVIKYATQEELVTKLQEQNVLILRKLRQETRKNRLGITDESENPTEGQRYTAPVEFKPQELTPDERVALSRDLLDPERQAEATKTLWKSVTGVDPDTFNGTLSRIQMENIKLQAKIESDAFVANNKDYVKCTENFEAITNWMMRYELAPTRDNFQKAYDALKSADILIIQGEATPVVQPQVLPVTPVNSVIEPVITSVLEPVTIVQSRIASGLTRDSSGDGVPATPKLGEDITYQANKGSREKPVYVTLTGQKALDAMPSDEYKRRLYQEKGFKEKAEAVEAETLKTRKYW